MKRTRQGRRKHRITASITDGKAPAEPKHFRKLQLDPEGKFDEKQTTSTPAHIRAKKRERTPQGTQEHRIPASFAEGEEPKCLGKLQLHPEGKLDREQTSPSTPAHIHGRKRERTSKEKQTSRIPASNTGGEVPSKQKCVRKLQLDPAGSLDEEQTSTSTPANMHARKNERTSQERPAHTITEEEAPAEPHHLREIQLNHLDPEGSLDEEQTSTSTTARMHTTEMERTPQGRQTHRIPASITEGKGKPFVKECHEKIETEGGKDQLASCRIEVLQIPNGAAVDVSVRFSTDSLTYQHRLTKQGTSKASSRWSGNTNRQCQGVTEEQITTLAELLNPSVYSKLCHELGIKYNLSCQIKDKHLGDYKAAYEDILHQWKDDTGGPVELLDKVLVSCRLGGLISGYKEKE